MVTCNLCGGKTPSTSKTSNSNLMEPLQKQHASTKLVEKEPEGNTGDAAVDVSSADAKGGATPAKQRKLDFTKPVAPSITRHS